MNRGYHQNSARLTRWLDRLAHFDLGVQYIVGSNLKLTNYPSRNPVGEPRLKPHMTKSMEKKHFNRTRRAEHKIRFVNRQRIKIMNKETERRPKQIRNDFEQTNDKSQTNRTRQNKNQENKLYANETTTSG